MQLIRAIKIVFAIATVFFLAGSTNDLGGQPLQVSNDRIELGVVLRQLNTVGTFMMTTAHPDDENNALLSLLAKGHGLRTVLVTATRGDGGQNEIGPELFEALAVLRTEELLAAHRFDGAEQYFTRAIDFGYSFSREETFKLWGREAILSDFVRMIRTIRPDVIAAMNPDGRGGGQHHQASAVLSREAYALAADPSRFPEQLAEGLRPWQPKKFYFSDGFMAGFSSSLPSSSQNTTTINLGVYDSLLGRTYAEIGSHARSMHKCQGMSPLIFLPNQAFATYRLDDTKVFLDINANEVSLFDGIDTSIEGLARFAGPDKQNELVDGLSTVSLLARESLLAFESSETDAVVEPVMLGLASVRSLRAQLGEFGLSDEAKWEINFKLLAKERQFERAAILAHGIRVDVIANDGVVTSSQMVDISTLVANRGNSQVVVKEVKFSGFTGEAECKEGFIDPADIYRCNTELRIADDTPVTNIHWHNMPDAARYDFDEEVPFGVPFRKTLFLATVILEISSLSISIEQPIEYRYGDDVFAGEKRSSIHVVPRFSVDVSPTIAIIPLGTAQSQEIRVTVTNTTPAKAVGEVFLELPSGWTVTPSMINVQFTREDESQTVRFAISPGLSSIGEHKVRAVVKTTNTFFDTGYQVVEYPHIGRRHLVHQAETTIKLLDVSVASNLTVGYIEGVGDVVPNAIEQLGSQVELLDADRLAWGDLSIFDAIVVGVRAYERRADLRAYNERLLEYVDSGGTVIVQYNKLEFNDAQYGPFEAKVSRNRVTDERASVRVLATGHQVFKWPNLIDDNTWNNWVQERGLYFLGDKAPEYVDLIEIEDTFEWNPGVKRGVLVEARRGRGRWVYVGLGLWRQLPAGTTGAYQLLANLISLGAAD